MRVGLIEDFGKISKTETFNEIRLNGLTELRYFQALVVLDELSETYDEYGVAHEENGLRLFSTNPGFNGYTAVSVSSNDKKEKFTPFVWQLYPGSTNELDVSSYEEYCAKLEAMNERLSRPEEQAWQQRLEKLYDIAKKKCPILESSEHGSKTNKKSGK